MASGSLISLASRQDEGGKEVKMVKSTISITVKEKIIFKNTEVLHIPGLGFDGLIGYSPHCHG